MRRLLLLLGLGSFALWWALPPAVPPGMVLVPAGEFLASDGRRVWLDGFYIDVLEVGEREFAEFQRSRGRVVVPVGEEDRAAVRVSWEEAAAYAAWVGKRLPTAWEWEKAARGAEGRRYPWGSAWEEGVAAVFTGEAPPRGAFAGDVSEYGVRDLAGGVFEWVADPPAPSEMGLRRLLKGGCFAWLPEAAHTSFTYGWHGDRQSHVIGFRCARDTR